MTGGDSEQVAALASGGLDSGVMLARLAESYQAEAEATGQRLESEMAKARAAAMSEAEKIRTADRAQEALILGEASAEAGRRLAEIRAEVEVERNRTLDELGTEAEAMASQMVSAVLGPAGELR